MQLAEFRTVFAGVRPARLAILLDRADPEWQDTCRRILECICTIWGGKYSIIVPTDGHVIAPLFWDLLEAFDPDYICDYEKTGLDWKIGSPERYQAQLERELRNAFPDQTPTEQARAAVDSALERASIPTRAVSLELQEKLKTRLAPFFFENRVLSGPSLSACSDPVYPLTATSTILPYCEHPNQLWLVDSRSAAIPPLWIESVLGATYETRLKALQDADVVAQRATFDDEHLSDLFDIIMTGRIDPDRREIAAALEGGADQASSDYSAMCPFAFSMLGLRQYRSVGERSWEMPAVVVLGSTLEDFALYFNLSRIRRNVFWLLPEWLEAFAAASPGVDGDNEPPPWDAPANHFAYTLFRVVSKDHLPHIDFLSVSRPVDEVAAAIQYLASAAGSAIGPSIQGQARVQQTVKHLLAHPQVVFNTDNFAIPTTQQVLEGRVAGFFPTPKPKGFHEIVPYEHRWITELRVEGLSYPRHPALGNWIIRHHMLSTQEVRAGANGLCYFCPNTAYFGGDVDTVLVRPQVRVPDAAEVFRRVADASGWLTKISDKGFFSHDTVSRMGGLEYAAALVRHPRHAAVLKEYLKDSKCDSSGGIYLASDRRRYLDFASIAAIIGATPEAASLIDLLVERTLLHRGTVLKCEYCRTADWFPLGDLSDEFRCKRCRRDQRILSKHTLERHEPCWYYQLDEIVYQGLRNDMHVPVLTLDYLRRKSTAFSYADELEIWKPGLPRPFIEIDLCCICDGTLTIGEAKTTRRIEGGGKRERRSLAKYREAALGLGARRFVLATTDAWSSETASNAEQAFAGTGVEVVPLSGTEISKAS